MYFYAFFAGMEIWVGKWIKRFFSWLLLYKKYLDFLIYTVAYWRISYWNHLKFYKQISIVVKTISMFYCPCRHYNRIIAIIALENVRFTKYFDICGLLSFDLMLLLISCISILCFACKALGELYMYQYKYVCL